MVRLELRLLGPFQAVLNGVTLDKFDSNKVRGLLAYVALERNRPQSREVLAGLLWPEQPQDSAMGNLRHALADLRRVLRDNTNDPPFLMISRDMVQFNPSSDCRMDVIEFEQLTEMRPVIEVDPFNPPVEAFQRAISLYQGSFLEGFSLQRSAPFEEWMLNVRERLHRDYMHALYSLAGYYERTGELQLALEVALKQVQLEPWLEEAHQQIMRLLVFDGRRSEAMQQYETCKKALASELSVEPSDQTRQLYELIRKDELYIPLHFKVQQLQPGEKGQEVPARLFFAREYELGLLDKCLENQRTGENQFLFITGEAGSGKTALVREFIHRSVLRFPEMVAVYTNCNAFTGISDPYLPFIEILTMLTGDLEQAWKLGLDDKDVVARLWANAPEAIEALVEKGPDLIGGFVAGDELIARSRALTGIATHRLEKILEKNQYRRAQTPPGSGAVRQIALFDHVLGTLKHIARRFPLILAVDDLQWADADTANLLFFLYRRLAGSRITILAIYREEELVDHISGNSVPFLSVLRELQTSQAIRCIDLSQADKRQFIQGLVDSQPNLLGQDFRDMLEQVTSGIPLFAIELLQAMQERGDLECNDAGQWVQTVRLNWDQLPPRVESIIAEIVDRLPTALQYALAMASIEGDDFTAEVIAEVLSQNLPDLLNQLSGLAARHYRIVNPVGDQHSNELFGSLSHYRFRHHLFQEYFYFRQDSVERRHRHQAVGFALEKLYGRQKGEYAITLAHHFEKGGMREKAAEYLLLAGQKAMPLYAYERAKALFLKGLTLLYTAPLSSERDHLELSLLTAMSGAIITAEGYTSSNLEQVFTRARKYIDKSKNEEDIFSVLTLLKSYYNIRGDPENSRKSANHMLRIAKRSKDVSQLVLAHSRMTANCLYYGRWKSLQTHLNRTIELYDFEKHREITDRVGSDPKVNALSFGAIGAWIIGYPEQAYHYCKEALDLATSYAHPIVLWFANYYAALLYSYSGDFVQAGICADTMFRISDEHELDYYRTYSQVWRGWHQVNSSEVNGLKMMDEGINQLRKAGDRLNLLLFLRLHAEACLNTQILTRAGGIIEEALDLTIQTQIIYERPELFRLMGEILLARSPSDPQPAEEWFLKAIECAVQYKTRMWELRSTTDLAQLWLKQGKVNEARSRLAEIYGWFRQGFDDGDLRKARTILDQLG